MENPCFIFMSYRRSDSISEAGRIYDSLSAHFGREQVFKDVFDIPYGVDFVEHLDRAVSQCQVLIAIIGKTWVDVTNADGKLRLEDPEDFVRVEIASALKREILVIPVLVNGAAMPSSRQLPGDLKSLARRNAAIVRHDPDYHDDMNRLIGIVRDHFNQINQSDTRSGPTPAAQSQPAFAAQASAQLDGGESRKPQTTPTSVVTLAVLSFTSGLLCLLDPLIYDPDLTAILLGIATLITCSLAALGLLRLKPWGWSAALFSQVFTFLVSVGMMFYYGVFEVDGGDVGFNLVIPILCIVVMASLFRPRIRRWFA